MELHRKFKIVVLGVISVLAVILAYDILGLIMGFEFTFIVAFIGVVSGFVAMKLCPSMLAKCFIGVPTALNGIVFLYFCSPLVLYIIEVIENA